MSAAVVLLLVLLLSSIVAIFAQRRMSQLSYQNRLLKALRSLDIAAISTVEIQPLCQAIVDVVRKELGYFFGVIALVDYKVNGIKRVAISTNDELEKLLETLPIRFKDQIVPFSSKENLFIKVINSKQKIFTENLYDIQAGVLPIDVSQKIQKQFNLGGVFLYPLIAKGRVIGIVEYPTQKRKEKISQFEYTIMEEFTAEVARVLDDVMLYQNLKDTTKELDISNQALKNANQRLKELDQLKDDFVSVASHELRTPMTAIRSYVWMALHKSDVPLSQRLEKYLYRTLLSTERLINLVSDMLNVSRIEAGKIEINPKPFNIVELVKDVMEEVKVKSDEKRLQLLVLEHSLPQVFADADKVHQVLLNLIGNALKFTYPGGTISVNFFTDGKSVEISVKDNGAGIAKDDLAKLFHKFSRLDNSYTAVSTSGGTGLGLYISKSLVELMHGSIWAQSEGVDKGSTFTFSLPLATQDKLTHISSYQVRAQGEIKELEPVVI